MTTSIASIELYGQQDHIQIAIYARDNPDRLLDFVPDRIDPEYLDEFGDGGGSFTIRASDPRLADVPGLLDYTNIVRVLIGGRVVGRWLIMRRQDVLVGEGEDAEAAIKVSGPGLRHWFSNAVVYPEGGVMPLKPTSRSFSFATVSTGVWYVPAAWKTPVVNGKVRVTSTWGTAPADWPDAPNAQWIWDRFQGGGASFYAPQGDVYFRRTFSTTADRTELDLFITADNMFDAYLDGVPILSKDQNDGIYIWRETHSKKGMVVGPGTHVLAIRATNTSYEETTSVGPGALAVAMFKTGNAALGQAASLLFVSDANTAWKMLPYPDSPPGFSPGELLKVLFDEARVRGVRGFSWLNLDFTATTDSNSVPWPRDLSWNFAIGKEYADVVKEIEEVMADVWIDPATLQVKVYQQKGIDRSSGDNPVVLAPAFNLTGAEIEGEADILKNTLLLGHDDGVSEWRDATKPLVDKQLTEAKYGRIEGFLNLSSVTQERAEVVAEATYETRALPNESTTVDFVVISGHVPWVDFGIGDWVLAPARDGGLARRRVMSVAVKEDGDTGRVLYSCEFDTVSESRARRIERWLKSTSDGTLGGTIVNAAGRIRLGELGLLPSARGGSPGGGTSSNNIHLITESITIEPEHIGSTLECDFATNPGTITIPTHATYAWPVGTRLEIRQIGTGKVLVSGASGVTIRWATAGHTGTRAVWSTIGVQKRGTNEWVVTGDTA